MTKILVFLLFSFLLNAFIHKSRADEVIPAPSAVPVISMDDFAVNKTWTWSYFTKKNEFYSSERYRVIAVKGSQVELEMASTFKPGQPVKTHHHLVVDVSKCLAAYEKPGVKKTWAFKMYYWNGSKWESAGDSIPNAAFEEKFNCNPHVVSTPSMETVFDVASPLVSANSEKIFQQRKNKRQDGSWYFLEGENAGVVAQRFADTHDEDYGYMLVFQGTGFVAGTTPMFGGKN